MKPDDRFWAKVNKTKNCWEWIGQLNDRGYGVFWLDGKDRGAHRISWVMHNGEIPSNNTYHGTMVCHSCDNRKCVNPAHLFLGDAQSNMDDMMAKDRNYDTSGSRNGNSKLTEKDVVQIKSLHKSGISYVEIGRLFSVAGGHISQIVRGKKWSHL